MRDLYGDCNIEYGAGAAWATAGAGTNGVERDNPHRRRVHRRGDAMSRTATCSRECVWATLSAKGETQPVLHQRWQLSLHKRLMESRGRERRQEWTSIKHTAFQTAARRSRETRRRAEGQPQKARPTRWTFNIEYRRYTNGGDEDRTLACIRPLIFIAHAITAQGLEVTRAA